MEGHENVGMPWQRSQQGLAAKTEVLFRGHTVSFTLDYQEAAEERAVAWLWWLCRYMALRLKLLVEDYEVASRHKKLPRELNTLNQGIYLESYRDPSNFVRFKVYSLIKGYWAPWVLFQAVSFAKVPTQTATQGSTLDISSPCSCAPSALMAASIVEGCFCFDTQGVHRALNTG